MHGLHTNIYIYCNNIVEIRESIVVISIIRQVNIWPKGACFLLMGEMRKTTGEWCTEGI